MQAENKRSVVAIFHDVPAFERSLDELLKTGFDASAISVLGSHQAILDHFGEVPDADELADAPDTPRDTLETESALHEAIEFITDTLAVITEFGAAAAAYAVGGPVGVAATSGDLTDRTVESLLSEFVDDSYHERFEKNVRDGGLICWVRAPDDEAVANATRVLSEAGAEHVHETSA